MYTVCYYPYLSTLNEFAYYHKIVVRDFILLWWSFFLLLFFLSISCKLSFERLAEIIIFDKQYMWSHLVP